MRLRLSIRRNGLPETLITWAIDTTHSPTIYQLLEQVNEVVPVESDGEWGLEDYAVELKGSNGINYECLHFQSVASVMKEDDEVMKRSFSGRTQITADGKRLFDGVPWGRPLLRTSIDRPSIKIPPERLSRLKYNLSAEENRESELFNQNENSSKKVVIQSDRNFELDDDDSESDEDYIPENEVDGSESDMDYSSEETIDKDRITTESKGLNVEKEKIIKNSDPALAKTSLISYQQNVLELDKSTDRFSGNFDFQARVRFLHSAFPTSSLDVCKYVLTGTDGDLAEAWEAMSIGFPACKSLNMVKYFNTKKMGKLRDREPISENAVALYKPEDSENVMIKARIDDNILEEFDNRGLPSGSIASGEALSCMAKAANKLKNFSKNHRSDSDSSSHAFQSTFNESLTNSSKKERNTTKRIKNVDFKSAIDENKPDGNALDDKINNDGTSSSYCSTTSVNQSESTSESHSVSCDDSRSDSSIDNQEPEESSSKKILETRRNTEGTLLKKPITQPTVPPGQGKKATQLRNKRRRISNLMRRQKEKGILPVGISKEEFIAMYEKQNSSTTNKQMSSESEPKISIVKNLNKVEIDDEFQRRRKVLLDSLASGGVDISSNLPRGEKMPTVEKKTCKTSDSVLVSRTQVTAVESKLNSLEAKASELLEIDTEKTSPEVEVSKMDQPLMPQADPLPLKEVNQKQTKSSQRSMLNLDAGRRMVFAAMGFKPPVTEQDKEIIRKELMNNSNSLKNTNDIHAETIDVADKTEDPEAWREKIIYRAKECVQPDVELCEPPFPFVQRWDPQQITKKRKINSSFRPQNEGSNENHAKRQKKNGEKNPEENFESLSVLSYKENSQNEEYEHPDDLIPIPDDPSSLPSLQVEQIKMGMIIIFKQLEVSAATRWQPQISGYKTATVLSTVRGKIQVQLARRDFHNAEKLYNEQGERIYSGFDTIDIDETEDDGWRELHFNELIEPKILEDAENKNVEAS